MIKNVIAYICIEINIHYDQENPILRQPYILKYEEQPTGYKIT